MSSYRQSSLSYEEERQIAFNLEDKHGIFNKFWSMIRPRFTERIPTAAVGFDKLGNNISFIINPTFWAKLTMEQKLFVICHECLHVMLSHGFRGKGVPNTHKKIANIAMDLVVNHMLLDRFGFERDTCEPSHIVSTDKDGNPILDKEGKPQPFGYWFLDRVKGPNGPLNLPEDKSFEFYYSKLSEIAEEMGDCNSFDDHGDLESFDSKEFAERLAKELNDMNPDEVKDVKDWLEKQFEQDNKDSKDGKQAGSQEGNILTHVKIEKPVYKKKWETIIKNWVRRSLTFVEVEQWARKARRLSGIMTDFMLPSDMETEETDKQKLDVWFFQDTSGSCAHLAERFFKAARSIPPNKFNVKLHCFDTRVYPMSQDDIKNGKLYGFGGTTFTCIEDYVRKKIQKENIKVMPTIFVISDGYGDNVNCTNPKQWYWFLSADYTSCIPKECKIFKLDDFE